MKSDLDHAVTFLSRYLHKPGVKYLTQARNTLWLLEIQEYGIHHTQDIARLGPSLGLINQKLKIKISTSRF